VLLAPKFAPIACGEIGEQNVGFFQDILAEIVVGPFIGAKDGSRGRIFQGFLVEIAGRN
jgi:hypothetical protein